MKLGTLLAAVAGAIVMFLLGFLFFGVLLSGYFSASTIKYAGLVKDPPEFICLFLFNLVWLWLVAFVADYWAGARTFAGGAKVGAIILFCIALGLMLQNCAFMNMYTSVVPMIVYVLVVTVMGTIAGGVTGIVLGFFSKKETD